jgi:hypothetical protein
MRRKEREEEREERGKEGSGVTVTGASRSVVVCSTFAGRGREE